MAWMGSTYNNKNQIVFTNYFPKNKDYQASFFGEKYEELFYNIFTN